MLLAVGMERPRPDGLTEAEFFEYVGLVLADVPVGESSADPAPTTETTSPAPLPLRRAAAAEAAEKLLRNMEESRYRRPRRPTSAEIIQRRRRDAGSEEAFNRLPEWWRRGLKWIPGDPTTPAFGPEDAATAFGAAPAGGNVSVGGAPVGGNSVPPVIAPAIQQLPNYLSTQPPTVHQHHYPLPPNPYIVNNTTSTTLTWHPGHHLLQQHLLTPEWQQHFRNHFLPGVPLLTSAVVGTSSAVGAGGPFAGNGAGNASSAVGAGGFAGNGAGNVAGNAANAGAGNANGAGNAAGNGGVANSLSQWLMFWRF